MRKSAVLIALGLVLALSFGALAAPMVSGAKYKHSGPYKVGFANVWVGNTWGQQSIWELESEASRYPEISDLYITDAQNNAAKQVADVEDMLAKKIDLLVIQPVSPQALAPVIEKATAAGVVVVTVASPAGTEKYAAGVRALDEDFGRVGAEWLVDQLDGKGSIIVLDGMAGITVATNRLNGAMAVFKKYPGIKIVGHEYADWDYAKGKMATENLLAANPKIDGVWSSGGDMTRGAIEAFVAARRPLVPMTGEDCNGFLKLWKKYQPQGFKAIGASFPTYMYAEGVRVGIQLLKGQDVPRDTVLPVPTITDQNLDKYLRPDLPDTFWANTRMTPASIKKYFASK